MNVIGDVRGKDCILFDDLVDTGGSLCNAAKALVEVGGAKSVQACASHGVLSGPAIERINDSVITELALLDTIPAIDPKLSSKIKYLPVAPMFCRGHRAHLSGGLHLQAVPLRKRGRRASPSVCHIPRLRPGGEGRLPRPWRTCLKGA